MMNMFSLSLKKTPQLVLLLLVSIYLIFAPSLNLLAYDEKRVFEVILIGITLLLTLLSHEPYNNCLFFYLKQKQQVALVIIILLLVPSSLLAASPKSAFLDASLYLGLIFFGFYFASISRGNHKHIQLFFFITLAIAAFCYQINFFTAYLASFIENMPLRWPEPFSGFSHVRFFNQYQLWTFFLLSLPFFLYRTLDKRLVIFLIVIAVGWASLLFASGGRGAVGSILIALLLTAIVFRTQAKPLLFLNFSILFAGFATYFLLFKVIPSLLDNQVTLGWLPIERITQSSGRSELWRYAIQYITDNPCLGIGPMHYAYYPGPINAHPHNSILQWASEMGIPSTLLVIFLTASGLVAWVRKFFRARSENKYPVSPHLWIALFCTMCSGLIYSMVSGVIVMPLTQTLMASVTGWMLGLYFIDQPFLPINEKQHVAFKLLAGITLVTLTYTVIPDLITRLFLPSELSYVHFPNSEPRFWQIGGIPH